MNCAPQLTADEFKDVHNAKCELHGILQRIEGVVHDDVYKRLEKAIELLYKGLKSAYEQDEEAYQKNDAHFSAVQEQIGATSIWSIEEATDLNANHPYVGATHVSYTEHWGDQKPSVEIKGTTWKDLYRAADKAIRMSGDQHHVFIEGFSQDKEGADQFTLNLSTGS